ncbi:hypothetical protein ACT3TS_09875 [Specibacter sp. AOP5-B1-6]|uniref:hypothetical protein n=1 Tax=Specibacter sp. AOP5-B1-6 TaxID=3457653 RepID=UPI00402B4808
MTNPITRPGRTMPLARRRMLAVAASAAVVLLAACSSPASPEKTPAASSSASAAAKSATATASPTSTPASASTSAAPATSTAAASAKSAVKKLVAGFPVTVLPLMKSAEIQASSLEHSTPVSVASLTASVKASSADVLAHYTKIFTDQGFTAQPGDAVDGVPLKTFVRAQGQEIVTVSVVQTASTATFTVGATLLPASFK